MTKQTDMQTAFDLYAELANEEIDWKERLGIVPKDFIMTKIEIRAVWGMNNMRGVRFVEHLPLPSDFGKNAYLVFIRENKVVFYMPYMFLNHAVNALRQIVMRAKDDKAFTHVKILGKNRFMMKAELVIKVEVWK